MSQNNSEFFTNLFALLLILIYECRISLDIYFRVSFCSLLFETGKTPSIIKLDWDRSLTMKLTNSLLCVVPLDFFTSVTDRNRES